MSRLLALLVVGVTSAFSRQQLNPSQPVSVTLADGTTRILTATEFEALSKERAQERATLQTHGDDTTERRDQKLDDIQVQDPQFALLIDLAKGSFKEIQRHGYAQGYTLAGFTEQKMEHASTDHHVELELRAKKDPSKGVMAKTGTGTHKSEKEGAETPLNYEVHLSLDAEKRLSVVAAWELSDNKLSQGHKKQRVIRLSIQPTVAMLEREAKQNYDKPAFAIWLLAGGLAMIVAGVLIMYNTRNPIPRPKSRRRSSDIWELVDENDKPLNVVKTSEEPFKTERDAKKNV
ncbi:uncharacterized protein PHALS_07140 [Plasmopara halstedii]|uniref:RxLR-like protein n=1 Tax=Plasmopara halstedii TaxID=4781 RepID=A0A0P1B5T0_PLAHL|nr:uncharacterized protein PHALS_07140 [Plasmopara halstedii]CEG49375.1 hypothetical protein PHALS_07140 [Plasmopara halstedii]|eukprot:XP_024585744.1 hypothetical protein PHALS_07140 [Plasmopara halstedii]